MGTTAVNPETSQEFDLQAFMARRNAPPDPSAEVKEEPKAKEEPKPEVKAADPEPEPPVKVEDPKPEAKPRPSRRERWLLKQLGKQEAVNEQLNSRLAEIEAKSKGGDPATEAEAVKTDPEPQRADFSSEAEFVRALGPWVAHHEAKQFIDAENKRQTELRTQEGYQRHVKAMDAKEDEDMLVFDDWNEVKKAALEAKTPLHLTPALTECLAASDKRAAVKHFLCTHPEASKRFESLFELNSKGEQTPQSRANQIQEFLRIEGRCEAYIDKYLEKKARAEEKAKEKPASEVKKEEPPPKPKPTAEERDAKKAAPSAAISPRGGSIADDTPKMLLGDGTTINPKWLADQNAQRHQR